MKYGPKIKRNPGINPGIFFYLSISNIVLFQFFSFS